MTRWEERLCVELKLTRRSGSSFSHRVNLSTSDGERWEGDDYVAEPDVLSFSYSYVVCEGDVITRREWDAVPRTFPASFDRRFLFHDFWRDIPEHAHLYSSACAISNPPSDSSQSLLYYDRTLIFRVQAPQLQPGESLAIVGNQPSLGMWRPERALRMSRGATHEWIISLTTEGIFLPIEYKYVRVRERTGELLEWESGDNRLSPSGFVDMRSVLTIFDSEARLRSQPWRLAGLVVPVFSLRSEGSQGVGDFGDLGRMVDWAHSVGMRAVQLLPINDTTQRRSWRDSYPYNCVSVFALHPLYIDLRQLPPLRDEALMKRFRRRMRTLESRPELSYERVMALKSDYLRMLYEQEGQDVLRADSFQRFYDANQQWLLPYAVFCTLRDRFGTADFSKWPQYSVYDEDEARLLASREWAEVGYHAFVQYLLDGQLSVVSSHARSLGVVLKGDIPIGISPHSVEAWTSSQLFHLDVSAGAPPDAFSATGQNWGFPTYDWERMAADGYSWWTHRLQDSSNPSSCAKASAQVAAGTVSCPAYSATFSQNQFRWTESVIPFRGGSPSIQKNLAALLAANSSMSVDLPMRRRPRHVTSTPWSHPHNASRSFKSRSLPTNINSPKGSYIPLSHKYVRKSIETFLLFRKNRIRRKVPTQKHEKTFLLSHKIGNRRKIWRMGSSSGRKRRSFTGKACVATNRNYRALTGFTKETLRVTRDFMTSGKFPSPAFIHSLPSSETHNSHVSTTSTPHVSGRGVYLNPRQSAHLTASGSLWDKRRFHLPCGGTRNPRTRRVPPGTMAGAFLLCLSSRSAIPAS